MGKLNRYLWDRIVSLIGYNELEKENTEERMQDVFSIHDFSNQMDSKGHPPKHKLQRSSEFGVGWCKT